MYSTFYFRCRRSVGRSVHRHRLSYDGITSVSLTSVITPRMRRQRGRTNPTTPQPIFVSDLLTRQRLSHQLVVDVSSLSTFTQTRAKDHHPKTQNTQKRCGCAASNILMTSSCQTNISDVSRVSPPGLFNSEGINSMRLT